QNKFTAGPWSGHLLAKSINTNTGQVNAAEVWDAADQLRAQDWRNTVTDGRQIITWNPNVAGARKGAAFQHSQIGATNQGYLNANQVNFLRGDNSNEGTLLRDRDDDGLDFKLGDIVNSAPIFVGTPPFLYRDTIETSAPYSAFRTANATRMPIVYVGANDGMLHGFNACADIVNPTAFPGCDNQTAKFGNEKIAYVPSTVYPILPD